MRRESSTVVAVVGEFGDGLLPALTQSPNVSVARAPNDAAGQPSADEAAARLGGRGAGSAGGGAAPVHVRDRVRRPVGRRRSGVAGYVGAARRVRRVRRTGRASRGGEVRGTRRRGAGRLAGQALRAARLLPGRGPSAAGCRGPGPVPRPAARGAAAPGRRGGRRGQRGPGGAVAGHAPVAGARAVVAAAGRAARRGPPLLRRRPRRDPVVARVVAPEASPRPQRARACGRAGLRGETRRALVWSRRDPGGRSRGRWYVSRMEFQDVVQHRRMVRSYDTSRPVPAEVVDRIVRNGLRAPSAGFSQGWGFLVLDTPSDVARFRDAVRPA